jgi:hypothetical protein
MDSGATGLVSAGRKAAVILIAAGKHWAQAIFIAWQSMTTSGQQLSAFASRLAGTRASIRLSKMHRHLRFKDVIGTHSKGVARL